MESIIITGGAGYIGSHTIVEILSTFPKCKVYSIDNYINSEVKSYQRIEAITSVNIQYFNVDLSDFSATKKTFSEIGNVDGLIHFAALKSVGDSVNNPLLYYKNNIDSLLNVLDCCNEMKIKNLIFSSSCSVYGNIADLPVTEATPCNDAESPYAYTKQLGERIISDFVKIAPNLNAIALRYFNPVGAHESGTLGELAINKPNNLVPIITNQANGKLDCIEVFGSDYETRDGTCIRDYIHVSDLADAHIKALGYLKKKHVSQYYDVINIGTGSGVSVLEALDAFEKVTGVKLNYKLGERRTGDVVAIYSDTSKATQLLKWQPQRDIFKMMESAWKWEQFHTTQC